MYEIKKIHRMTNSGIEIPCYKREVVSANILEVEAGTNGYKGGDTGHGSRTYLRIEDLGSTDIQAYATKDGFAVELGGDCELSTFIEALKFAVNVLEDQALGNE